MEKHQIVAFPKNYIFASLGMDFVCCVPFSFFSLVSAAWTTIVFWVWPHVFKGCVEPKALYSLCDCDDLCFNLAQRERNK